MGDLRTSSRNSAWRASIRGAASRTDAPGFGDIFQMGGKTAYTNPSNMKRRVVITGIGAISPNGNGKEAFWEATRNGISGVDRITRFDASSFPVQVAGE